MKIHLNGRLEEKSSLEELFEPGFLFGWGAFETLRAYSGKLPFLKEHINRLNQSLEAMGITPPKTDFNAEITRLLKENSLSDAYVRISAYKKRACTGTLITAETFTYYTAESYEKGFSAITCSGKRNPDQVSSRLKSLSYLDNRIAWFEAQKSQKDEGIVLNTNGLISGGARSNVFLVKNGTVFRPSPKCSPFPGLTAKAVEKILSLLRIELQDKPLSKDDAYRADEAFLTSSLLEIMPLVEYDGNKIAAGTPGEISKNILQAYRKMINEGAC